MKSKRSQKWLAGILSAAMLLSGSVPANTAKTAKTASLSKKALTITVGKSKTLKVKNAKKKVTWKVAAGKKVLLFRQRRKVKLSLSKEI